MLTLLTMNSIVDTLKGLRIIDICGPTQGLDSKMAQSCTPTHPGVNPVLAKGWYSLTVINLYTISRKLCASQQDRTIVITSKNSDLEVNRLANLLSVLLVHLCVDNIMLSGAILVWTPHGLFPFGPNLVICLSSSLCLSLCFGK